MEIRAVLETNGRGVLLYAENFPGAFVRGASLAEAMEKWRNEMTAYLRWRDGAAPVGFDFVPRVVQEKCSGLRLEDADSDVLFESEKPPLEREEYERLKELCLRSASGFCTMYESVPEKSRTLFPARETFYGTVPRTAEEIYQHTKNVNSYYFAEIGVEVGSEPDMFGCRKEGFAILEQQHGFLKNPVFDGSYGELWTLRKVLRRFLWHDRIHARALIRHGVRIWGSSKVADPFFFLFS